MPNIMRLHTQKKAPHKFRVTKWIAQLLALSFIVLTISSFTLHLNVRADSDQDIADQDAAIHKLQQLIKEARQLSPKDQNCIAGWNNLKIQIDSAEAYIPYQEDHYADYTYFVIDGLQETIEQFRKSDCVASTPTEGSSSTGKVLFDNISEYHDALTRKINQYDQLDMQIKSALEQNKFTDVSFAQDLANLSFMNRIGINELQQLTTDPKYKLFLNWLFDNTEVLNTFMDGGDARDNKFVDALVIWEEIWRTDIDSRSGLYLTLAMAVALEHANRIDTGWYQVNAMNQATVIDPYKRYENYKRAHQANKLYPVFDTLDVWHMRMVVGAWATDSDLDWARETYRGPHSVISELGVVRKFNTTYNRSNIATAGNEIEYKLTNASGISVQNGALAYYGANATLQKVLSVGGVCGAIAKYGTVVAQAYGVPAMPIGQPGHAASIFNSSNGVWEQFYDIFGFGYSFTHRGITIPWADPVGAPYIDHEGGFNKDRKAFFGPAYVLLYEDALRQSPTRLTTSERLRWLAYQIQDQNKANKILQHAIEIAPLNIVVWRDYLTNIVNHQKLDLFEIIELQIIISTAFKNHPRAFYELLSKFVMSSPPSDAESGIKSIIVKAYMDRLKLVANRQQIQIGKVIAKHFPEWDLFK